MQQIILVGGGGHCKSCIDVIEAEGKYQIAGIVDMPDMVGEKIMSYPVIGTDDDLPELAEHYKNFLVTVGQIKSAEIRIRIFNTLNQLGVNLPVIISPFAYVSEHVVLGVGTIIMHHAIVNADAAIGVNCIINTKALIEHEAFINSHTHISTAAIINGQCEVGKESFIGSNAVLANNIEIADNTIVAAGSVMLASVFKPGNIYIGHRTKRFNKKKR